MQALDGIRVLDLTRLLPGPAATMFLADFGADVIKIEEPVYGDTERTSPPLGPGNMGYRYLLTNRNKKSVTVNLKDPRGVEAFLRLARTADVVIEGFRPGVVDRLGIGYEALRDENPRLIYCSLSGYGQTGPYATMAGHDINYLALSGVLSLTGLPEQPVLPGVQIADLGAGAMMAAMGILLALAARERTGEGQFVDVSMLDGSVFWLTGRAQWWFGAQTVPQRGSLPGTGGSPGYNIYRTQDDKFISVGALEPHFWERLCGALDLPEFAGEQGAAGNRRDEIFARFQERFAERTQTEWFEHLRHLDACAAPVLDLANVWDDPHIRSREMLIEVEHPEHGTVLHIGIPIKLTGTPGSVRSAAPQHGEHTDLLLRELGYSAEDLALFRKEGVVR